MDYLPNFQGDYGSLAEGAQRMREAADRARERAYRNPQPEVKKGDKVRILWGPFAILYSACITHIFGFSYALYFILGQETIVTIKSVIREKDGEEHITLEEVSGPETFNTRCFEVVKK